jgi:cell division GTPase FtsZ
MSTQGLPGEIIGSGTGLGASRAVMAAKRALEAAGESPFLRTPGVVGVHVRAGDDFTLDELYEAACTVQEAIGDEAVPLLTAITVDAVEIGTVKVTISVG